MIFLVEMLVLVFHNSIHGKKKHFLHTEREVFSAIFQISSYIAKNPFL
jgi:hypothetical protein